MRRLVLVAVTLCLSAAAFGQDFDASEFAGRRVELFERTGDGVIVILGNPHHLHTVRFHQSPDFFYLTGISEPDGVLVMDGKTRSSTVFLRKLSPFEAMWNGPRLLNEPNAAERYGIDLRPLSELEGFLEEVLDKEDKLYVEQTPPDQLQAARNEVESALQEREENPLLASQLSDVQAAIEKLRAIDPDAKVIDVTPILDRMRWKKSPYEVERMREAGRIGAEGFVEAIRATHPGIWEYQIEATASHVYEMEDAGDAFLPIVASGPNTVIIHYQENDRRTQPGDVILMDYGAEFDGYASDITRMWPVSGRFTEGQEKMYRCILEASKAVIAAIKPGIKESDLQDVAEAVYEKYGYLDEFRQWGRYIGHPVGLSVHDPDPGGGPAPDAPFQVGTVFNVEPLLTDLGERVHMRLEDTILVTEDGAENLTAGVPAELDAIYALVGRDAKEELGMRN